VPGHGVVDRGEILKGYEYEKNRYITIDPAELASLKLETTDTLEIVAFISSGGELPIHYLGNPYYLTPDGIAGMEAYRAIRDALQSTDTYGIGRVVISMVERTVAIMPYANGIIAYALKYPDEIKPSAEVFDGIDDAPTNRSVLKLVEQLIDTKLQPYDPNQYHDTYQDAVRALVKDKLAGVTPTRQVANPPKVINLMDALKASLQDTSKPKRSRKAA
jgi:DNA end-binding protein Ku